MGKGNRSSTVESPVAPYDVALLASRAFVAPVKPEPAIIDYREALVRTAELLRAVIAGDVLTHGAGELESLHATLLKHTPAAPTHEGLCNVVTHAAKLAELRAAHDGISEALLATVTRMIPSDCNCKLSRTPRATSSGTRATPVRSTAPGVAPVAYRAKDGTVAQLTCDKAAREAAREYGAQECVKYVAMRDGPKHTSLNARNFLRKDVDEKRIPDGVVTFN